MSRSSKTVLLFDAETQHYRQSVYRYFQKEFKKHGYHLKVVYDKKLNDIREDLFLGIDYSFKNFNITIADNDCCLVILFVWLRYKFLIPFMLHNRIKGAKTIVWSHCINLQKKKNKFKNILYGLRQRLADALIIFSVNEKQYIKVSHKKVFTANNTLNFYDIPMINLTKEELKAKYGILGKKIILSVGRMATNNRKPDYLITGFTQSSPKDCSLVIVGPGLTEDQQERVKKTQNIHYLGPVTTSGTARIFDL